MGRKYIYNSSLQTRIVDLRILFEPCRQGRHYQLFDLKNRREIGKNFGVFLEDFSDAEENQDLFQTEEREEGGAGGEERGRSRNNNNTNNREGKGGRRELRRGRDRARRGNGSQEQSHHIVNETYISQHKHTL